MNPVVFRLLRSGEHIKRGRGEWVSENKGWEGGKREKRKKGGGIDRGRGKKEKRKKGEG